MNENPEEPGHSPESPESGRPETPLPGLMPVASILYLLVFFAGYAWIGLRGDGFPLQGKFGPGVEAGAGAAIGIAVAGLSALLGMARGPWRALEDRFKGMLSGLTPAQAFLLAALSSIGEETFFRGALQPAAGLAAASLIFGLLHVGPSIVFLAWTGFAVAMGFLLGLVFDFTGSLAAPVAAHFTVNFLTLARLGLAGAKQDRA